jgi:chromosome segregation ATPase
MMPLPQVRLTLAAVILLTPALFSSGPEGGERARADTLCTAVKNAARQAAEADRRAREFDRQAQTLTQESSRLDLSIRQIQNDERTKATRLAAQQKQLRESARQTENAVQTAHSRFNASHSQSMDAGSRRALNYVESVLSSLSQFSGGLARCAEMPQSCSAPVLNCPAPPDVSISPGAGPSSRFIRDVNASNRQFVQEYYESCSQAGRAAAQTVQELRAAQSDLESVRRRLQEEQQRKEQTDLKLRESRSQAAQASAEANRFTEEARRDSQAADALIGVKDYCRTPLVDYSARVEKLRSAAAAAGQKTEDLMKAPGKDSR